MTDECVLNGTYINDIYTHNLSKEITSNEQDDLYIQVTKCKSLAFICHPIYLGIIHRIWEIQTSMDWTNNLNNHVILYCCLGLETKQGWAIWMKIQKGSPRVLGRTMNLKKISYITIASHVHIFAKKAPWTCQDNWVEASSAQSKPYLQY